MHTHTHYAPHTHTLSQFIKRTVSKGGSPMLGLASKEMVKVDFPPEQYLMPNVPKKDTKDKRSESSHQITLVVVLLHWYKNLWRLLHSC